MRSRNQQMRSKLLLQARQMVYRLSMLLRTSHVHDVNNQALVGAARGFVKNANQLLALGGELHIQFASDVIFLNNIRVKPEPLMYDTVMATFKELGSRRIGGLRVLRPLEVSDVQCLLATLVGRDGQVPTGPEEMAAFCQQAGSDAFSFLPLMDVVSAQEKAGGISGDRGSLVLQSYVALLVLMRMIEKADPSDADQRNFLRARVVKTLQTAVDMAFEEEAFFLAATCYRKDDEYQQVHAVNSAYLCIALGHRLGLARRSLLNLGLSALMANRGMSQLPDWLVNGDRRLSPEARAILQRHPLLSVRQLLHYRSLSSLDRDCIVTAYEHHIREDGAGYPHPLPGKRLHLFSRLLPLADHYDAMTSNRPWRKAALPPHVLEEMGRTEGSYDEHLRQAFFNMLTPFPPGTCVQLNKGPLAVVFRVSRDLRYAHQPIVKVVTDRVGNPIWPTEIDLRDRYKGRQLAVITRVVSAEEHQIDVMKALFSAAEPPEEAIEIEVEA